MTTDARLAYREAAVRGASQVGLVIMLYNMLVEDVGRAISATRNGDAQVRSEELKHAFGVLEQLQGTLNMEQGGDAARNLDHFYSIIRAKLLEAHLKSSLELLQQQLALLVSVREAWQQAECERLRGVNTPAPTTPILIQSTAEREQVGRDWRA
jgi:flagellar protein FliS